MDKNIGRNDDSNSISENRAATVTTAGNAIPAYYRFYQHEFFNTDNEAKSAHLTKQAKDNTGI